MAFRSVCLGASTQCVAVRVKPGHPRLPPVFMAEVLVSQGGGMNSGSVATFVFLVKSLQLN